MSEFILRDSDRGNERTFETRAEAEDKRDDLIALGASPESLEIEQAASDGGETVSPEVVEEPPRKEELPDEPSVEDDPVDWLPSHFIDTIQGTPTVNRKGYAVIASKYNVSVTSEPITLPSETEFEYAEFRAVATTEDGQEYSGFGSAHINRQDGDDPQLLGELAETRAMKRAVAWATGIGLTAIEELKGGME